MTHLMILEILVAAQSVAVASWIYATSQDVEKLAARVAQIEEEDAVFFEEDRKLESQDDQLRADVDDLRRSVDFLRRARRPSFAPVTTLADAGKTRVWSRNEPKLPRWDFDTDEEQ